MTILDPTRLDHSRPKPLYDKEIHRHYLSLTQKLIESDLEVAHIFKQKLPQWLQSSKQNRILGLEKFFHKDIIHGVTHSLDDLHARFGEKLVFLPKDYAYHKRINPSSRYLPFKDWKRGDIAILSLPFSHTGEILSETQEILDHCSKEGIPIHIDAAWFGPNMGVTLDLNHEAIESVSFSLSKPLGLGKSPIGLRFTKERPGGPVSVINDFHYYQLVSIAIGLSFIENFSIDYFTDKYSSAYKSVIESLDLLPSPTLHVAFLKDGNQELTPVGIRGYLRQIIEGEYR